MPEKAFPRVDPQLIEALEEAFPLQEISEIDTFDKHRWRGAQRSVIQFLKMKAEDQHNNTTLENI